jgi:hypothetical protein
LVANGFMENFKNTRLERLF